MTQRQHDRRIDYIEISVTDLPRAKDFYHGVFGWAFQDWGDEYASFNDGRLNGGLRRVDRVNHGGHGGHGGVLVIIYSADLEAVEQAILGRCGRIVEPTFHFPGGRRFHFEDSETNVLAVWSDIDSDGSGITV